MMEDLHIRKKLKKNKKHKSKKESSEILREDSERDEVPSALMEPLSRQDDQYSEEPSNHKNNHPLHPTQDEYKENNSKFEKKKKSNKNKERKRALEDKENEQESEVEEDQVMHQFVHESPILSEQIEENMEDSNARVISTENISPPTLITPSKRNRELSSQYVYDSDDEGESSYIPPHLNSLLVFDRSRDNADMTESDIRSDQITNDKTSSNNSSKHNPNDRKPNKKSVVVKYKKIPDEIYSTDEKSVSEGEKLGLKIIKRKRFMAPNEEPTTHHLGRMSAFMDSELMIGKYTKDEKEKIDAAVAKFLDDWNVPREHVHYLIKVKNSDANPYLELAKTFLDVIVLQSGLNRSKRQIYWYLLRKFQEGKGHGKWTEEEDRWLMEMVRMKGKKWSEIERDIGRSNCRERYRRIVAKVNYDKGQWTEDEEYKLIRAVRNQFEDGSFDVSTAPSNWEAISMELKTKSWIECMNRWYDVTRFIVNKDIRVHSWTREDHMQLLIRMSYFNCTDESGVNFPEIARSSLHPSWGRGVNKDQVRFEWARLRKLIPDIESRTFKENIQWAIDNYDELKVNYKAKEYKKKYKPIVYRASTKDKQDDGEEEDSARGKAAEENLSPLPKNNQVLNSLPGTPKDSPDISSQISSPVNEKNIENNDNSDQTIQDDASEAELVF